MSLGTQHNWLYTAAITLDFSQTPWAWNKDTELLSSIQDCRVHKSTTTCRGCMQTMQQRRELTYMIGPGNTGTFASLKVHHLKVCVYRTGLPVCPHLTVEVCSFVSLTLCGPSANKWSRYLICLLHTLFCLLISHRFHLLKTSSSVLKPKNLTFKVIKKTETIRGYNFPVYMAPSVYLSTPTLRSGRLDCPYSQERQVLSLWNQVLCLPTYPTHFLLQSPLVPPASPIFLMLEEIK